ncbi:hypothetical protein E0493_03370 [Roseomonas sp. M0104]|uniref:Glycosyltransferase RgtA/B/C/D-like domain-containing protein n=2 Tax=Teichococcus coralli TaxID=2545983 RepID=A0A845BAI1_9PROT|nr:hypothetical protein [Pseudoroseomonas coralli]
MVLALLPALAFLGTVLAPPLNHDVAAVLDFTARMFGRERLYGDLIDVNPPLIFLLNLPAVWLAQWTPLTAPQALRLLLLAFCAIVWGLCAMLRARPQAAARREGPAERAVLAALLPLLMLGAGYDFGQREQIMAAAALPYLFLAERRMAGVATHPALLVPVALVAALGFALKPHFLAVPALVEALVLLVLLPQRGAAALRDPVPWLLAAVWVLYLAAIPLFFPAYFGRVLPLVWDWYVGLGGGDWWEVMLTATTGSATVFALGLVALAALAPRLGGLPRLAAAATLGGLAAALVQHKGWSYHLVPVWTWGGLGCGALLARGADRALPAATAHRAAPLLAAGISLAFALFTLRGGDAPWTEFDYAESRGGKLAAWLEHEARGERLLVLSPDIPGVYPAVNYADAKLVLPFMSTWLLQATYQHCEPGAPRYREPWAMSRAEFLVYRTVAESLAQGRPAVVMVSRWSGIPPCNGEFDMLAYFSRNPLFAEAWRHYRPAGEIDGYMLFKREEE